MGGGLGDAEDGGQCVKCAAAGVVVETEGETHLDDLRLLGRQFLLVIAEGVVFWFVIAPADHLHGHARFAEVLAGGADDLTDLQFRGGDDADGHPAVLDDDGSQDAVFPEGTQGGGERGFEEFHLVRRRLHQHGCGVAVLAQHMHVLVHLLQDAKKFRRRLPIAEDREDGAGGEVVLVQTDVVHDDAAVRVVTRKGRHGPFGSFHLEQEFGQAHESFRSNLYMFIVASPAPSSSRGLLKEVQVARGMSDEPRFSPEMQQKIQTLQGLGGQLQQVAQQKQQLEMIKSETDRAKKALDALDDDAVVYRNVGAFMIQEDRAKALARVDDDAETLEIRLKRFTDQEKQLQDQFESLQEELQKALGQE